MLRLAAAGGKRDRYTHVRAWLVCGSRMCWNAADKHSTVAVQGVHQTTTLWFRQPPEYTVIMQDLHCHIYDGINGASG